MDAQFTGGFSFNFFLNSFIVTTDSNLPGHPLAVKIWRKTSLKPFCLMKTIPSCVS